jgi:hypothetical protein
MNIMKTKLFANIFITILILNLVSMPIYADSWYTVKKNCKGWWYKYKIYAKAVEYNILGQQIRGGSDYDKGCNSAGPRVYTIYTNPYQNAHAEAYASSSNSYAHHYSNGSLFAAGTYFVNTHHVDTVGFSKGDLINTNVSIDYLNNSAKGNVIIQNINAILSVSANSNFGSLFRIIIWAPDSTLANPETGTPIEDSTITAQKTLWEASVRIEHRQLIITGVFNQTDFLVQNTSDTIADSSGYPIIRPAMKVKTTGNLLNNGISLDIQNDILLPLSTNNPRQVPLSTIQNANADNIAVTLISDGGYGDFVDDIAPPLIIPTMSQWGLIILALLLLSVCIVFLLQRQVRLATAGANSASANLPLFDRTLFFRVLGMALLVAITGLALSLWYFGSLTNADIFGTLVSTGIVAYIIHVLMLANRK